MDMGVANLDNLKYYNDSFAYDYDIFAPKAQPKKADILEYPNEKKAKARKSASSKSGYLAKSIVAVMILAAVCGSLYLRAEISSIKSQINGVNKEITELRSEVTRLNVEVERKISLTNLELAAKELGMQKCEKNQVTYIKTNEFDTAANADGNIQNQPNTEVE